MSKTIKQICFKLTSDDSSELEHLNLFGLEEKVPQLEARFRKFTGLLSFEFVAHRAASTAGSKKRRDRLTSDMDDEGCFYDEEIAANTLYECSNIDEYVLTNVLPTLSTTLRTLIIDAPMLNEACLYHGLRSGNSGITTLEFKSLRVRLCAHPSTFPATVAASLTTLKFTRCPALGHIDVLKFANALSNLSRLEISGCAKTTRLDLATLSSVATLKVVDMERLDMLRVPTLALVDLEVTGCPMLFPSDLTDYLIDPTEGIELDRRRIRGLLRSLDDDEVVLRRLRIDARPGDLNAFFKLGATGALAYAGIEFENRIDVTDMFSPFAPWLLCASLRQLELVDEKCSVGFIKRLGHRCPNIERLVVHKLGDEAAMQPWPTGVAPVALRSLAEFFVRGVRVHPDWWP